MALFVCEWSPPITSVQGSSVELFRDSASAGILCQMVPRSHQCRDLRHLSKCSAHFLQLRCLPKHFLSGDRYAVGSPQNTRLALCCSLMNISECSFRDVSRLALALEFTGYSDIQDSVAHILPNQGCPSCEEQSPFLPALQVTHNRTLDKMFPQPPPHSGTPGFYSHHDWIGVLTPFPLINPEPASRASILVFL
jgi:hypothetical protein